MINSKENSIFYSSGLSNGFLANSGGFLASATSTFYSHFAYETIHLKIDKWPFPTSTDTLHLLEWKWTTIMQHSLISRTSSSPNTPFLGHHRRFWRVFSWFMTWDEVMAESRSPLTLKSPFVETMESIRDVGLTTPTK